ncbi:MAG: DUF86 domain-containing protein [Nanoarchaeota archaeon]|nr:DUF86 domain-containing protein [Nanoarchaeota archaeon]MBU1632035.1 DUF86 domain-containing protein [Nanoarchaeota archaeon]MBU1875957.1 DUF86 domain-containing protein [Nanoarchaeota archaeon]
MISLNEKILIKLEEMDKYLTELETMLPEEEKEYLQDLTLRRACEKTIELAIESVIDMISIIVAQQKLGLPQSEDDLIKIISDKKIISHDLSNKIKQMKGFRNILVHKYGHIDDKLVYKYLKEEWDDFLVFEKEIKKYIHGKH